MSIHTLEDLVKKLDGIEVDAAKLTAENERLISERVSAYVELDAWVSLTAKLAQAQGYAVGLSGPTTVVIDLPAGQVSWEFAESEAHMYESFAHYDKPLEVMEPVEKYVRILNPGL